MTYLLELHKKKSTKTNGSCYVSYQKLTKTNGSGYVPYQKSMSPIKNKKTNGSGYVSNQKSTKTNSSGYVSYQKLWFWLCFLSKVQENKWSWLCVPSKMNKRIGPYFRRQTMSRHLRTSTL